MKTTLIALSALLILALALAGCGKSEQMKKLEAELNDQVMKLHDAQMKTMEGVKELVGQIDAGMARHTELAQKFPKQTAGHTSDDLVAAKEKLTAVQSSMETWMKGLKKYDVEEEHEVVMARLTKNKDELVAMQGKLADALSAAKTALTSHNQFADDIMKKLGKKGIR